MSYILVGVVLLASLGLFISEIGLIRQQINKHDNSEKHDMTNQVQDSADSSNKVQDSANKVQDSANKVHGAANGVQDSANKMEEFTVDKVATLNLKLSNAGEKLVVLYFTSPTCKPCKILTPQLEAVAAKTKNVVYLKLNYDQLWNIAIEYKVTALPTVFFIEHSKVVNKYEKIEKASIALESLKSRM